MLDDKPFALIVEDDRDIVALFRHVLDVAGYHTEISMNGLEAMERIESAQPDIILLDLQLPGLSGLDILKRMREDERMKTIPVVVITAYPYYLNSLPQEPDMVLLKPVDLGQLSNLVQRLKATKSNMRESPYDKTTNLYTVTFFSVRMTFALERVKQLQYRRFGVLFADLSPFDQIRKHLRESNYYGIMYQMAEMFKKKLRPTDTTAWIEEGCFLALIEEVTSKEIPPKIAGRVSEGLGSFLAKRLPKVSVQNSVGVVLCDEAYDSVQEILDDIHFARELVRNQEKKQIGIYTRQDLHKLRDAGASRRYEM
jgi:CheY-like chemotaxis protein